jgi:hypothetical protein
VFVILTGGQLEKRRRQPTTKKAASEGRLLYSSFGVQVEVVCWCIFHITLVRLERKNIVHLVSYIKGDL